MEKTTRLTLYLLMLASVSVGCAQSPQNHSQTQTPGKLVSQTTQEVAQAAPVAPANPATPAPTTPQPKATQEKPLPKPNIPGLIPSTNANSRRSQISRQRQDPFVRVPAPAKITSTEENSQPAPPLNPPKTTPVAEAPKKPEPDLARQVVISGLIDFDGRPQLIVKAPDEPFSRYVEPGQYLSNGRILVKEVRMSPNSTPIVILEQSGMRVTKRIGETT